MRSRLINVRPGNDALRRLQDEAKRLAGEDKPFLDVWFENESVGNVVTCSI